MAEEIVIQSMYMLSPVDVKFTRNGIEHRLIIHIDFARNLLYYDNGSEVDEGEFKQALLKIINEKRKVMQETGAANLPLESVKLAMQKEKHVGN